MGGFRFKTDLRPLFRQKKKKKVTIGKEERLGSIKGLKFESDLKKPV